MCPCQQWSTTAFHVITRRLVLRVSPLKCNLTTSCGVNSLQQAFSGGFTAQTWHLFRALKNSASPDKKVSLHVLSQKLLHNSEPTELAKPFKVLRAVV